jgi:ATP-binding cassette, subfamily C, bacteriocin exporter
MLKNVVVKQRDIKDCGAASLLSIIKYYGGYVSLEKIREDTSISKNGITAYNLIIAANKYGFDAKGVRSSKEDLLSKKIILPAIAYVTLSNGLNHYMVIYKINKNSILVMDPAVGIKKIKIDEFISIWQNVLIILCPRVPIIKYEQSNKLFDMLLNVFSGEYKLIYNLFVTSLLLTLFSIISSFYMKIAINEVSNNLNNSLKIIVLIFLLVVIIKTILTYLKSYYENYLNKNIDVKIIIPFINHIFKLPSAVINNYTSGEIMSRINELSNIKDLFSNVVVTLGLNLLMAVTSCIVLYSISSRLFICLVFVLILYLLFNFGFLKPIENSVTKEITENTNFNSIINNYISSFNSLKNINYMNYFNNNIESSSVRYLTSNFKLNSLVNSFNFGNNFIIELGLFITNTIGLYLIFNHNLELIDLITFDSLYFYLIDPIKQIINLVPKFFFIKQSFAKINDFILLKEEDLSGVSESFSNGDINILNTSFTYNRYNYPLKNFNLIIKKGTKVLITGSSGCGKSTLFKLIYRLYEPENGEICIDNINIKDYDLNTLRNNITYVSQDEIIFTDTIKNNITLGREIPYEMLKQVIKICQLDNIFDKKALRLDAYLLENGDNLSGGEKARIILARSLLKNTPIILIDETLSQIEEKDANKIINEIMNNYQDKTIILVSHFIPRYNFDQVIRMVANE